MTTMISGAFYRQAISNLVSHGRPEFRLHAIVVAPDVWAALGEDGSFCDVRVEVASDAEPGSIHAVWEPRSNTKPSYPLIDEMPESWGTRPVRPTFFDED